VCAVAVRQHPPAIGFLLEHPAGTAEWLADECRLHRDDLRQAAEQRPILAPRRLRFAAAAIIILGP
jgi:hypothetical protein